MMIQSGLHRDMQQSKDGQRLTISDEHNGQYGAGALKLTKTCGITLEEAKELHKIYWKRNHAVKKVAEAQKVIDVDGELWLLNPISNFYYSLRSEKDKFSTLVQGTAAYVFDLWLAFILSKRDQLTAQFHDEIVLTIKKGHREGCTQLLEWAIDKTNDILKLNRELAIGIQYGSRYSDIH